MRYPKKMVSRAAQLAVGTALSLGLLGAPLTAAASGEAKLTVTATVLKHASLKVLAQPANLVITAADLARGYVDVPASSQLAIHSNVAAGYLLDFRNLGGEFMRQIFVRGLNGDVQLSPAGGLVQQGSNGAGVTRTTLALGYRFMLSSAAQAGTYAWPMQLSVMPL